MSRVSAGALLLIAFLVLGVTVSDTTPTVDLFVADAVGDNWQATIGDIAFVISAVLGPVLPVLLGVGLLVGALLAHRRGDTRRRGLLLRATVLLAVCRAVSLVKPLFQRDRPREYPDFSFPSGHVVSVASAAFTVVVLCAWLAASRVRAVLWWSIAAVSAAALCRMVLDVHWLTDVLGATLGVVGVGLLTATGLGLLPARRGSVGSQV